MASTFTKALLGKEDVQRHDPATDGTSPTTVNRLTSTGGTTPITKWSANDTPLLDAPIVSGATRPFDSLADTQAAKNVEKALAELRKNHYNVKNFEFYGGLEGTGITQAQADKNREVWDQIIADLPSAGGAIFFPPGAWLFDGTAAGVPILTTTSRSNITILGAGFGSLVRAFDGNSGTDLIKVTDGSNWTVRDIAFDKIATGAGSSLVFEGSAGAIGQIRVLNVQTNNGFNGVMIDGGGQHGNGYWIENCYFLGSPSNAVEVTDMLVGQINRNFLSLVAGGPGGIQVKSGAAAGNLVGSLTISENVLAGGGTQDIAVERDAGLAYATSHKDVRIIGNRQSLGVIGVVGLNQVEISANELLDGGISYQLLDGMVTAQNFKALYNQSRSASGHGLSIDATNVSVDSWEIVGGRYYLAGNSGIFLNTITGGGFSNGRIIGVHVLDCNQGDAGHSGIRYLGGAGTTITRNLLSQCIVYSTAAPKHQWGASCTTVGATSNNFYSLNMVQGWQTAAYNLNGFAENVAGINEDLGA